MQATICPEEIPENKADKIISRRLEKICFDSPGRKLELFEKRRMIMRWN